MKTLILVLSCLVLSAIPARAQQLDLIFEAELKPADMVSDLGLGDVSNLGDVDRDGRDDILFRLYGSHPNYPGIAVMDGRTGTILTSLSLGPDANFLAGLRDLDGDGKAEVLVRYASNSEILRVYKWNPAPNGVQSPNPDGSAAPAKRTAALSMPNPTSGLCRVAFRLASAGAVSVQLFDPAGRMVRQLLRGAYPAGDYSPLWDGKNDAGAELPPGVYFTRVETPAGANSGKIVLAH
jgi:hypothetical protein